MHGTDGRGAAARGVEDPRGALEALGPVPGRARLGHGAGGLLRARHRLGVPVARPRPLARVPLERGRDRGDLRSTPDPLLRARALERTGPDPEGANLRAHRQRGEPRRGREGALLLPRLDADALVHADALQVPAARVPLRGAARREPPPDAEGPRVRALGHGAPRGRALLRRVRRIREGRPGRPARPDRGVQPRAGAGAARPAPDPLVPEHLELERREEAAVAPRGVEGPRPRPARHRGRVRPPLRGGAGAPLHRERHQRRTPLRRAERRPSREGRLPRVRRGRARRRGEPRPHRHQVRGAVPDHRPGEGERGREAPPPPRRDRRRHGRGEGLRRHVRGAQARGGRIPRRHRSGRPLRGRAGRPPPVARRDALVEAVLPLRRARLARGGSRPAEAGRVAATRPERRLGTPLLRRRPLHAGQVGVPLVRGLGPGLPLRAARDGRSRLREGAARAAPARVVHAPERPDRRIRVGLRRREPARPRLGREEGLRPRGRASTTRSAPRT